MTTAKAVFEKSAAAAEIARDLPQPLRRFYKLGKRTFVSSKAEIKVIAEKVGVSEDYVRKVRMVVGAIRLGDFAGRAESAACIGCV